MGTQSVEDLQRELETTEALATSAIEGASTSAELTVVKQDFLGKGSALTKIQSQLGGLDPSDRKAAGQAVNASRTSIETTFEQRLASVVDEERSVQLAAERVDLSEVSTVGDQPTGHAHIVTQAWEELEDVFVGMGFRVAEGPEVETDWHNFDALNIPPGHPARDGFDTIYVEHGKPRSTLLRTHTSPVQIRAMMAQEPPIYVIAPGRVFRQDTADATHMPVFHQLEGLVIDRNISLADLAGTIDAFTESYFGEGFSSRLRPNHFPFTEPSAEFDIQRPDGSWLELGGCGMVHPNVLRAGGVDPEEWSAFAFGFGIDRLALLKFGVDDLRELFTNDMRFLQQF